MTIETIQIKEEITLDEAERVLIRTVNFGDYLAEKLKESRLEAKNLKAAFSQKKEIQLIASSARDAKARELQAENQCFEIWSSWQSAEIESNFIQDLARNNHDKAEALRTVISSKKTVFEKTYNSKQ